ncbi:response regulator transcription factor [soil metagenome]
MIRVVLADDQALMRTGFRMILDAEADIEVIGEAENGLEAVEVARRIRPDLVLMDVRMPKMDGVVATTHLAGPDVANPVNVLILTTFDLDEYVYGALRAGACGFLLKDAPPEELVHAIRVCSAGDALLAPGVTKRLISEFAERPLPREPSGDAERLTGREREVLTHMARGLSNAEIADALYVSETTVKTHVGRVLSKLGLRDRVQAVVYAYEQRLVLPGE